MANGLEARLKAEGPREGSYPCCWERDEDEEERQEGGIRMEGNG